MTNGRGRRFRLVLAMAGAYPAMAEAPVSDPSLTPLPATPPCTVPVDPAVWFKEEVHVHDEKLKAFLRSSFPRVRDVEDIAQESYLKVWKARAVRPIGSAKTYLFQTAKHLALNFLRDRKREPIVFEGDIAALGVLDSKPHAAQRLSDEERIQLLTDAMAELPELTCEILVLRKFDGLSQSKVAQKLGLTEKSVERRASRGIEFCIAYIRRRGHDRF